jgi:hypothetical protein
MSIGTGDGKPVEAKPVHGVNVTVGETESLVAKGWKGAIVAYLLRQRAETVMGFLLLGFIGYWMLYIHPQVQQENRDWHKAERIEYTTSLENTVAPLAEAVKEAAVVHAKSAEKITELHSKEVDKIGDRLQSVYEWNRRSEKRTAASKFHVDAEPIGEGPD